MRRLKRLFSTRRLWLSEILEGISIRCRSAALYYELEHYVKCKTTRIKRVFVHNRGSGKTYALVRLAIKYKAPIYQPTERMGRMVGEYIRDGYPKAGVAVYNAGSLDVIRGRHGELCFVDEGIGDEILRQLKESYRCVIGYRAIH